MLAVFNRHFQAASSDELVEPSRHGLTVEVGDAMPAADYVRQARPRCAGFRPRVAKLGAPGNPARVAAAVEFVLEGLHLNRKLNKDRGRRRAPVREADVPQPLLPLGRLPALPDLDADECSRRWPTTCVADGDVRRALQRLFRQGFQNARRGADARAAVTCCNGCAGSARGTSTVTTSATCSRTSGSSWRRSCDTERQGIERRVDADAPGGEGGEPAAEAHRQEHGAHRGRAPRSARRRCRRICRRRSRAPGLRVHGPGGRQSSRS